jgi:hypothetical protein
LAKDDAGDSAAEHDEAFRISILHQGSANHADFKNWSEGAQR